MPIPYNFTFLEGSKTYKFITKNQIEYRIAFVVDETLSSISGLEIKNIYQMIIEKVSDDLEIYDTAVALTIKSIIVLFFENSENTMIYFCDDSDKKAIVRIKTFERWYLNSKMSDVILKVDNIIKYKSIDKEFVLYTSLLYNINNSNKDLIIEIYKSIEEVLNSDKF